MKVKWTKEAREQFKEILRYYTKRNRSASYSTRLKRDVYELVKYFRGSPYYGTRVGDNENVRRVSFGNFVILYEVKPKAVEIYSIRDGRRKDGYGEDSVPTPERLEDNTK